MNSLTSNMLKTDLKITNCQMLSGKLKYMGSVFPIRMIIQLSYCRNHFFQLFELTLFQRLSELFSYHYKINIAIPYSVNHIVIYLEILN